MTKENKENETIGSLYKVEFVKPNEMILVKEAVDLVNNFNQHGLMLPVTQQHYVEVAKKGLLVVAKNRYGQVIGTAAYSQFYDRDIWEFGGWAVAGECQHHGVGMKLIKKLFGEVGHVKTIAFGNKNSGPIFETLGAKIITDHSTLPEAAFALCNTCPNKPKLGCCDTIYNLGPVVVKFASEGYTTRQIDRLVYGIGEPQSGSFVGWDKDPKEWT